MSDTVPLEAEALLTSEPLIAHLATCTENDPHVAPLWYNYRDGHIEIVTTRTKAGEYPGESPRRALGTKRMKTGMANGECRFGERKPSLRTKTGFGRRRVGSIAGTVSKRIPTGTTQLTVLFLRETAIARADHSSSDFGR